MTRQKLHHSIIDHTTTCPYCGHRVLHENLIEHIKRQHPGEAEEEKFEREIVKTEPNRCLYCGRMIDIHNLEEHIYNNHPSVALRAINKLKQKEKEEKIAHRKKRENIARQYGAKMAVENDNDREAPWEWRLARQGNGNSSKKTTKASKKLPVPLFPIVKGKTAIAKQTTPGDTVKKGPSDWSKCSICGALLKTNHMDRHMRKAHGR